MSSYGSAPVFHSLVRHVISLPDLLGARQKTWFFVLKWASLDCSLSV